MKILITGQRGFIGQELWKKLEKKYQLYGKDLGEPFPTNDVDLVIHLAGNVNTYKSVEEPTEGLKDMLITYDVLEWMRLNDVTKILYTSSKEAIRVMNMYGAGKRAGEAMIEACVNSYGFGAVNARLTSVIGPNNKGHRLITNIIEHAKEDRDIYIYGGHAKIINFIHINECVSELIKLIPQVEEGKYKTKLIASSTSYPTYYIAEKIVKKLNSKSKIISKPERRGETLTFIPDPREELVDTDLFEMIERDL